MKLTDATRKVKKALSTRDTSIATTHYHFHNGMVTASNGFMTAAAPISERVESVVPADEFDKALAILGDTCTMVWGESNLTMKQGRRRVTINTLPPENVHFMEPASAKVGVGHEVVAALRRVRPFLSDDAARPWAMTAWLRPDPANPQHHTLTATNNICIVNLDAGLLEGPVDVNLPDHCIDYLLTRDDVLTDIAVDSRVVTLYFVDGSYLTSRLYAERMPDRLVEMLDNLGPAEFAISPEWVADLKALAQLSEDEVQIFPDRLHSGRRQAEVVIEQTSRKPEAGEAAIYHPKFLLPVVSEATHFDMWLWPQPARFSGKGIRGIIAGRR